MEVKWSSSGSIRNPLILISISLLARSLLRQKTFHREEVIASERCWSELWVNLTSAASRIATNDSKTRTRMLWWFNVDGDDDVKHFFLLFSFRLLVCRDNDTFWTNTRSSVKLSYVVIAMTRLITYNDYRRATLMSISRLPSSFDLLNENNHEKLHCEVDANLFFVVFVIAAAAAATMVVVIKTCTSFQRQ